jgi:hypothetical protein
VVCAEHGVVVAAVPWARAGSQFTSAFEDTAAWLVCHATLSGVAVLLRIAWHSASGILTRSSQAQRVHRGCVGNPKRGSPRPAARSSGVARVLCGDRRFWGLGVESSVASLCPGATARWWPG